MPLIPRPDRRLAWWIALGLLGLAAIAALYALLHLGFIVWLAETNRWLADTVIRRLGYWGLFGLMFLESSLVPFPSEIVVPPAADLARRLPEWSLWAVVVIGTAGSLAGALFNYYLALFLGRPLLLRFINGLGRYLRLSQEGYEQAEAMFARHGAISTFTGRLIPGIRQIISLPAGLARMGLLSFSVLTVAGAGLWVTVLALLGYWFGANAQELSARLQSWSHWLALGAVVLLAAYVWLHVRRQRRAVPQPD